MNRNYVFRTALLLVVLALGGVLVILNAPEEQTLGSGIRSIYIHVPLVWTGMIGLLVAAALGLVVLATGSDRLRRWAQTISWVALTLFSGGFLASLVAAQVNWGGVFWAEPRLAASSQILVVALVTGILAVWVRSVRLRGLLHTAVGAFLLWTTFSTELVLHPRSPILSSTSQPIQVTFFSLLAICLAAAGWVIWRVRVAQAHQ